MKAITKQSGCIVVALILCAIIICGYGCRTAKQDPLAGWHNIYHDADPTIVKDYQEYIQKLSPDEKSHATVDSYFEDGTGQHAVLITIGLNHTDWEHVLIYDKNNKRIKTIKYISGHSMS